MKEYKLAVFIGRFQPFHNSHLKVVEHGLEIADKVLVIVGSSHAAKSIKNPFSFEERRDMIENSVDKRNVKVEPVRDYYYNHDTWVANVQAIVDKNTDPGDSVVLIGCYKDGSSYYLDSFPQYEKSLVKPGDEHGEGIRKILWISGINEHGFVAPMYDGKVGLHSEMLSDFNKLSERMPAASFSALWEFRNTKQFGVLASESEFIRKYKESWELVPFPPTFVTVDSVVTCSGHILVVERRINPGKGLFALPGGFIKHDEVIRKAAIRELREETRIRVDSLILDSQIVAQKVFDHPDRSMRGRTISHGFHIKLKDGRLPEVKGGDDAKRAFWMPLWDVIKNENLFFEDHAHIINYFTGVGQ